MSSLTLLASFLREPPERSFVRPCTQTFQAVTLSGTVGVIPALAGSAAAVGGLLQQLMGAAGGYVVGLVPHDTALGVGALMLLFTVCALLAQVGLQRRSADLR